MNPEIELPNQWNPREHQLPLWRYMQGGGLRGVAVWHRRAGKDATAMNFTATAAHEKIGTYWHLLPEASQGRKVIWDGMDKNGIRFIDQVFPLALRESTLENEMKIKLKKGSLWQVGGSDNYNSLLGANVIGVVFSEYSVANPAAWDFIRPILAENGGWAMFLYTTRGKNHGYKMYQMAKRNPEWFAQLLTVDDTLVIPPETIQAERDSGMDEDLLQQEYWCSWEGVQQGSIYGQLIAKARAEGRVGAYPYDRRFPVNTFWDIGGDGMAVCYHQQVQGQDRFLSGYEAVGSDIPHMIGQMKETGYMFGKHYFPHDAKNVTVASKSNPLGKNVWDQALGAGLRDLILVKRTPGIWTGINETRARFGTAVFNEIGKPDQDCTGLINALESYHKKWDETRRCFQTDPYHDWSSHYADAFRQWGQGWQGVSGNAGAFSRPSAVPVTATFRPNVKQSVNVGRAGY